MCQQTPPKKRIKFNTNKTCCPQVAIVTQQPPTPSHMLRNNSKFFFHSRESLMIALKWTAERAHYSRPLLFVKCAFARVGIVKNVNIKHVARACHYSMHAPA